MAEGPSKTTRKFLRRLRERQQADAASSPLVYADFAEMEKRLVIEEMRDTVERGWQGLLNENAKLRADVRRMSETLLLSIPKPDDPPSPEPHRHHYDYHDYFYWCYREDRETWVNEQLARHALGLPYIDWKEK